MNKKRQLLGALGVVGALTFGTAGLAGATGDTGGGGGDTGAQDQGCTPGYWKNHTTSWVWYSPSATIGETIPGVTNWNGVSSSTTLLQALAGGGGPGANGATRILLRAMVAAKLNGAQLSYPSVFIQQQFGAAIDAINAGDRAAMLELASTIDAQNNLGCPLGRV